MTKIEMFDDVFKNFDHIKNPYLITLIGPPLCGKSTFIKYFKPHVITSRAASFEVISRDALLLETFGSNDYTEAWKNVDQKEVDKKLKAKIEMLSKSDSNVIIDMTSMSAKGRIRNNNKFPNHYKVGVVLKFDKEELIERNESRNKEENKYIHVGVIDSMIESYEDPSLAEGFDFLIKL